MALIVAIVTAAAVTPLCGRLARRLGIVDRPGALKVQTRPVPYLGGVAVFIAIVAGVSFAGHTTAALVPLGLALALGVADDAYDLPVVSRLAGQAGVAVAVAVVVDVDGLGPGGRLVAALATVALVNAVNLIDGLDGLATGVVLAGAAGFGLLLDGGDRTLAVAGAGAAAGFLAHNRPPARIYLGDGGAYLFGTLLALLLAAAWDDGEPVATGVAALLLVALPLADTTVAVVRRARAGRPLFAGDRGHVYDQLVDRGWSPSRSAAAFAGTAAGLAALATAAARLDAAGAAAVTAGCLLVLAGVAVRAGFLSPRYRGSVA